MISKITNAGNVTSPAPKHWSEARETRRQLLRFLVVGSASVLIDLAVYQWLSSSNVQVDLAKGISYLAGVVVGFVGNKLWTFQSARRSLAEPLSYLALYGVTLLVNIGCNAAVLAIVGRETTGAITFGFLFATGVTTVLNFLGMRLVTFRRGVAERLQLQSQDETPHPITIHTSRQAA